jgi:D-3-phosphoglycerate dehydrogenase
MRILVVGDPYMPGEVFREPLTAIGAGVVVDFAQIEETRPAPARTESEHRLREYAGSPDQVRAALAGHDALVVHGAPVSAEVLDGTGVRLVFCARGGPVNVDVEAATKLGIPVFNTPGKNAEAVADMTIAFALMLLRRIPRSSRHLLDGGGLGESTFEGREFIGREAAGTVLGLVGYGHVGQQVAKRAVALGMPVLVHDPYLSGSPANTPIEVVSLAELLDGSDVVSLHARATPENHHLVGAAELAAMRPGAFLINTARESLVDEAALLAALESGRLGGAALDVVNPPPAGVRHPLLDAPNVLVTPHIGGATDETLRRGADMIAAAIRELLAGRIPATLVNKETVASIRWPA